MAKTIYMHKLGVTMDEGKSVAWNQAEGDQVAKGANLISIESDKAVMEYESPEEGVLLKMLVQPDDVVVVAGHLERADIEADLSFQALLVAKGLALAQGDDLRRQALLDIAPGQPEEGEHTQQRQQGSVHGMVPIRLGATSPARPGFRGCAAGYCRIRYRA